MESMPGVPEETGGVRREATHIRKSGLGWAALCGVAQPASSISEGMLEMIRAGIVPSFGEGAVTLCSRCVALFDEVRPGNCNRE